MRSRKKEENNTQKQNIVETAKVKPKPEKREREKEGKRNSQRGSRAELKRRAMRRHVVIFRKKSPQPWLPPSLVPTRQTMSHEGHDESKPASTPAATAAEAVATAAAAAAKVAWQNAPL